MRKMSIALCFSLISSVAVISAPHSARAAIIYSWMPLSGNGDASGTLDIADGAFVNGEFNWSEQLDPGNPNYPPLGPVNLRFQYFGTNMGSFNGLVLLADITVTMVGNGLEGHISANNGSSDIYMSGGFGGTPWTIFSAATDFGGVCGDTSNECNGDTGQWVLASAPTNVPEPMSVALLLGGFGFLAVIGRSRLMLNPSKIA